MRRRGFVASLTGLAAALALACAVVWPHGARAQPQAIPLVPLIGVLSMQTLASETAQLAGIRQGLRETGFVEGRNVAFDLRFAEGRNDRLPALAAELVSRRVNLIVANTTPPAVAAKAATEAATEAAASTIPIVFVFGADPVALGMVSSFNRPGGNITGVAFPVNTLAAKRLELLAEVTPAGAAIGMLVDPNNPNAPSDIRLTEAAAAALKRTLVIEKVASQDDLDQAFTRLSEQKVGSLFVAPNANFRIWRERLLALATQHKLPASYSAGEFVRAGGLMSYGPDQAEVYRLAGFYAGRILKGESPAHLPVVQPTKFETLINAKTARALGLNLPPTLLTIASEVIE
jgi:putative ABC transport system substrate-binding protein